MQDERSWKELVHRIAFPFAIRCATPRRHQIPPQDASRMFATVVLHSLLPVACRATNEPSFAFRFVAMCLAPNALHVAQNLSNDCD